MYIVQVNIAMTIAFRYIVQSGVFLYLCSDLFACVCPLNKKDFIVLGQ